MKDVLALGNKVENFCYPIDPCGADLCNIKAGANFLNNSLVLDIPLSSESLTHFRIRNCNK